MSIVSVTRFRTCILCGCTKPHTAQFFYRGSKSPSGLRYDCKACRQVRQKARRLANLELYKERDQRYEKSSRVKAVRRAYLENNREWDRARGKKWRESNRDKAVQASIRWQKANPDKKAQYDRTRRARKLGAAHEPYTDADLIDMWHEQGGCCYYCNLPVFARYHIEHKTPLSRGGSDSLENLCIACPSCNSSKKDKTELEFLYYRQQR